jgi:hypothetical protein
VRTSSASTVINGAFPDEALSVDGGSGDDILNGVDLGADLRAVAIFAPARGRTASGVGGNIPAGR